MRKSIIATVLWYALVQIALLVILARLEGVPVRDLGFFILFIAVLHGGLTAFLLRFRHYFTDQVTGLPLERINLANLVTLLRISCVPLVAFVLRRTDTSSIKALLPIILALVFLTDSFDGQIARRLHQMTRIGQMLDSISDYSLLGVISIAFFRNQIVPPWFIVLIFARLLFQALGMLLFLILRRPVETKSTWGGKIAVATIMSLYVAELIRMYLPAHFETLFTMIEYLAAAVIFLSFFEKAFIFARHGRATKLR